MHACMPCTAAFRMEAQPVVFRLVSRIQPMLTALTRLHRCDALRHLDVDLPLHRAVSTAAHHSLLGSQQCGRSSACASSERSKAGIQSPSLLVNYMHTSAAPLFLKLCPRAHPLAGCSRP